MSNMVEWYDANSVRQYPLADTSSSLDNNNSFSLPTSFIVDMVLSIPADADNSKWWVSLVSVRNRYADVQISTIFNNTTIVVGAYRNMDILTEVRNVAYSFEAFTQADPVYKRFEQVTGTIVIGTGRDIKLTPGNWYFSSVSQTGISVTRVIHGLNSLRGIIVNDRMFDGVLNIKAGNNILFDIEYDRDTEITTLTISASLTGSTVLSTPIVDDASLLTNLVERYGTPITSINGIYPSVSGNFTITGVNCTTISTGSNNIVLSNGCAKPCCDKSSLVTIYTSIEDLNTRAVELNRFYVQLGQNVNDIISKLTGVTG